MKPGTIAAILGTGFLGFVLAAIFVVRDHLESQELPIFGSLPAFVATNQEGSEFRSESLKGKITLLNFFFSSCKGVCPTVNGALARFRTRMKDIPDLNNVSVSVDPERDTVQVLAEYAQRFKADSAQWAFLTAPDETVTSILEQLKLGAPDEPMQHTSRVVLLDADLRVRGFYQGTDEDAFNMLEQDLRRGLRTLRHHP